MVRDDEATLFGEVLQITDPACGVFAVRLHWLVSSESSKGWDCISIVIYNLHVISIHKLMFPKPWALYQRCSAKAHPLRLIVSGGLQWFICTAWLRRGSQCTAAVCAAPHWAVRNATYIILSAMVLNLVKRLAVLCYELSEMCSRECKLGSNKITPKPARKLYHQKMCIRIWTWP